MSKILDIELIFFQDNATGEYGLTHRETYNEDNGFNAFWGDVGIFHDVFEHWFEFKHKYFKGEYAMNICGEMCAMGAMMWYYELIYERRKLNPNSIYSLSDSMRITTESMIEEAIKLSYSQFGNELLSKIPYQKPTDNDELEYQIETYYNNCKKWEYEENKYSDENERKFSKNFKKSIKFKNIANPHRYGYRLAQKLIPDNYNNERVLFEFLDFWKNYCSFNTAEELHYEYKSINVKIFKEFQNIRWRADLIRYDNSKNKLIFY